MAPSIAVCDEAGTMPAIYSVIAVGTNSHAHATSFLLQHHCSAIMAKMFGVSHA